MSSLNVTLTLYPNYGISEVKTRFCIQKDIQLSTIAQVKDQMIKKIERNFKKSTNGFRAR